MHPKTRPELGKHGTIRANAKPRRVGKHPRGAADYEGVDMPKPSCAVPGCQRPRHAKDWCNPHYARWKRDGNLIEDKPIGYVVAAPVSPCSIDGCEKPIEHQTLRLCSAHYARYRRYGDPTYSPIVPAQERFWANVTKGSPTDCWPWTGHLNTTEGKHRYGRISINGTALLAHVYSYQIQHGPVPDGLELDHRCRNTRCVNPDHLEAVTHRENVMRGIAPAAVNARKTRCKNGHDFTPENTLPHDKKGGRKCKTCQRASQRAYKARQKAVS